MDVKDTCHKKSWNVPKWLQMSRKEVLWTFLIVTIIGGAAGNYLADWLKSPPSIPQQIRNLNNPSPPFAVNFWIDAPSKTVFYQEDHVTLFYKVSGFRKDKPLYFTLLNISAEGVINPLLSQKEIHANQEYTLPEPLPSGDAVPFQSIDTQRLTLNTVGKEYFKAIVTSEPIGWKELLKQIQENVQPVSLWATVELQIEVVSTSQK